MVEAYTIKGWPYIVVVQFDNHAAQPSDMYGWPESNREVLQVSIFDDNFRNELIKVAKKSL